MYGIVLLALMPVLTWAGAQSETKVSASNETTLAHPAPNSSQSPSLEDHSLLNSRLNELFGDAVAALKQYVRFSPPFLLAERQTRIERLEKFPGTTDAELAEKYRRLLEAYRIELDYGKTIETYQAELITGEKKRLVDFLRIGQLALYYQTFDGLESGIWSPQQGNWQVLSKDNRSTIIKGLRIARKLEPPQLLTLPLFGMDKSNALELPKREPPSAEIDKAMANKEGLLFGIRENAISLKNFYQQQAPVEHLVEQTALLDRLIDSAHTPTLNECRQLIDQLLYRLHAQGHVSVFKAPVYAPDGLATEQAVLNVGGFSLIAKGHYLTYAGGDGRLIELTRQPPDDILELVRSYPTIDAKSLTLLAIDPSGGQILQLLTQVPNFRERVDQGGPVGYLILILGSLALLLSVYRFVTLTLVGKRIEAQLLETEFRLDNPLGRLLSKLDQSPLSDEEALYLTVEESLTTEQSRLEQGLSFLKLVAAIAPMLGLLGTVTGMIKTFQAIALHGSGDPKLMSGGISEALVTTVEGLVTAIPILLLHSLLSGKSQGLAATLEAQISVALAHRLEHRHGEPKSLDSRPIKTNDRVAEVKE